jgi:NAD(P)-dependent dehydrogenase (short-subunit alcohol dehydrogenase family)
MAKTVLITGTSSGMGQELVLQFARRGWNVTATLRNPAKADPSFAEWNNVLVAVLDVTDPTSIRKAVAETNEHFGPIDVLINNAGYAQLGALEEVSLEQLRAQYETNVFGVVNVVDAVLPQMRERRAGHIINIGSMGGHVSLPTMTVYTSSKFALEGITEGLAKEIAPLGIKVTLVEPAGYSTEFGGNAQPPATQLPDYDAARTLMKEFSATSIHGDLKKSMAAVADITDIENPPLRLAVGSFGLSMVRGKIQQLLDNYAQWESVTLTTD